MAMAWVFKARLVPSLAAVLLTGLFVWLGFWQLERADEKLQLMQDYEQRHQAEPRELTAAGDERLDKDVMHWRRVNLHGHYDAGQSYLLDNRTLSGRSGYYLYTRFILPDRAEVLVNRGWLPLNLDRNTPPQFSTPEGRVALAGIIKPPPQTVLLGQHVPEQLTPTIMRVQEVILDDIARENGWRLLPYVVRLEPPAPDGLQRVWQPPGFGREKHLGYAFQFFALAFALLLIYVFLTIKKSA